MRKRMKLVAVMLSIAMTMGVLSGCGARKEESKPSDAKSAASQKSEETKASEEKTEEKEQLPDVDPLESERPTLKILGQYTTADLNNDVAGKHVEEISGYHVEYDVLPQENADQQLLLSVSGECDYDILKLTAFQFSKLIDQGALADITDYIEVYGDNLKTVNSKLALKSTSDANGRIFGLSSEYGAAASDPYGVVQNGLAIREDIMEELNLEVPETLAEFVDFLQAIKDAKGVAPLTFTKYGFMNNTLLTAFAGIGNGYLEKDGTLVNRFKTQEMVDYLAFIEELFDKGLIDKEFAVNSTSNTIEKVASGNAYITSAWFYDIATLKDACKAAGSETDFYMLGGLKPDENSKATYINYVSLGNIYAIPKNAKHIADAVNYLNIISEESNYLAIYLGEEGVSYEVKDGKYYPVFPGFNDYANAGQFKGLTSEGKEFSYWCARARKTEDMAKAFAQMNDPIADNDVITTCIAYAYAMPELSGRNALNVAAMDAMLNAIVDGTDPKEAMDAIVADYDANGGAQIDEILQNWYLENKEDIDAITK